MIVNHKSIATMRLAPIQEKFDRLNLAAVSRVDDARRIMSDAFAEFAPACHAEVQVSEMANGMGLAGARVYVPHALASQTRRATAMFVHGGGFWCMSPRDYDGVLTQLAWAAQMQIIAPRYRLAPEHPFPAAGDDVRAAYRWLRTHEGEAHVDPGQVVVIGESAGGSLAAGLNATYASDAVPPPRLQCLIYPLLDLAGMGPGRLLPAPIVGGPGIQRGIARYLAGADPTQPAASPLRVEDVANTPPTLIVAGSLDPLLDESRAYVARLQAAGVPALLSVCGGLPHAFAQLSGALPEALWALHAFGGAIRGDLQAKG